METRDEFERRMVGKLGFGTAEIPEGVPADVYSGTLIGRYMGSPDVVIVTYGPGDPSGRWCWHRPEQFRRVFL